MSLSILNIVLYAGLVGVLIALFVATAQNKWQPRVFALLALRLAVGWHFCFEGLHKIHSHVVGETDTSKPFTSANYFNVGDGPGAEMARKQFLGDPQKKYEERLAKKADITPAEFRQKGEAEQAALCPDSVGNALAGGDPAKVQAAKAKYAAWVYGAATRDAKFKAITGDTPASAVEWLDYIEVLEKEYAERITRTQFDLGVGNGLEVKRTAAIKADLNAAKSDLAKATDDFLAELKKDVGVEEPLAGEKPIKMLDTLAMYGITAIGVGLLLGLFTRLWCVAGIGFLVMTYLAAPPWPWLQPPPPSEGNPLFINKNLIEAIALLVVLVHPTGKWLGLDALIDFGWHTLFGKKPAEPAPAK